MAMNALFADPDEAFVALDTAIRTAGFMCEAGIETFCATYVAEHSPDDLDDVRDELLSALELAFEEMTPLPADVPFVP
jgi:hypothetical protein